MALYIETKYGDNDLSPAQRKECWDIAESGACCLIINEKNVHRLYEMMINFRMRNGI
jgi:hypothetical protein